MKMRILKGTLLCMTIGVCVVLSGCGNSVNYDLTKDSIAVSDEDVYTNPDNSEDTYACVEINGVTYIPYGTQGKKITNKEVGDCIAYSSTDSDERFYEVIGTDNYIAFYSNDGVMEQFDFWRNIDTIGKEIDSFDFIASLGYEIWE
jgi:ABC-type oligopeptide transport system substrate-binding subunit